MGHILILGTGGTIAGTGSDPGRSWAYQAAQLSVSELVAAVPELACVPLATRQVAQIDSKDMTWSVWQALAAALAEAMADDAVAGVVITHGTDTLEETACLLHHLHDGAKPIVLTAAMRPATAPDADGPRNLRDAVCVARDGAQRGWGGVVAVLQGQVWAARDVRKSHSHALDAFDGGGAYPCAAAAAAGGLPDDAVAWPSGLGWGWQTVNAPHAPRVEILVSHADADGWLLDAALRCGHADTPLRGVVVAGTGHGTVHAGLEAALRRAADAGVVVWRSSRVARGGVLSRGDAGWHAAGHWTPAQARVLLQLSLLRGAA